MASEDTDPRWGEFSQRMSQFHDYFKSEFNTLYELADGSFTKRGLSLTLYLDMARRLNDHLTMHHTLEERHFFPVLGQKMPQFAVEAEGGHIESHEAIHTGLEKLSGLVQKFKKEPSTYSPEEMRACLDGFRTVLFSHLDQEVSDLSGDNLKKYFSLQELKQMPF
ncbi:Hemerythrin domain-containing protein [Mycena kentingensis (nom. inval.)]|nr:Hemerythrin domain-containing protein [Mycena kentingensis (nom. inval.)]